MALVPRVIAFINAFSSNGNNLTASSELLIWKPLAGSNYSGIHSSWEAFVLVPTDYDTEDSPLIPINVRKFQKSEKNDAEDQVNIWFIPGGPGQSSQTLDVYMDLLVPLSPPGAVIYAIDHRGLGKSTPLANFTESELLKQNDRNPKFLPHILERKRKQLGLLAPLTRVLRVENVARDLLKGLNMVKAQDYPKRSKNYLLSISYGTVIARRAVQIQSDAFEAVIFDGLAALERIEFSNEADRSLEQFCHHIPSCKKQLESESNTRIRNIIPSLLASSNQCTRFFSEKLNSDSLCKSIHLLLNATLLQGLTILKVAALRALMEMRNCTDFEGFKLLLTALDEALMRKSGGNALQSVAVLNPNISGKVNSSSMSDGSEEAVSINEFVFEVISALERYHLTSTSVDICFNKKHAIQGDYRGNCSSRLFDPCRFFQTTFERKMALADSIGELPDNSIKSPIVQSNSTRIIVLAGLLDFNTPTMLAREIFNRFFIAPQKYYHEFFGLSHGIFGSSFCEKEIFHDFLTGGNETAACVAEANKKHIRKIDFDYFAVSLTDLSQKINGSLKSNLE